MDSGLSAYGQTVAAGERMKALFSAVVRVGTENVPTRSLIHARRVYNFCFGRTKSANFFDCIQHFL